MLDLGGFGVRRSRSEAAEAWPDPAFSASNPEAEISNSAAAVTFHQNGAGLLSLQESEARNTVVRTVFRASLSLLILTVARGPEVCGSVFGWRGLPRGGLHSAECQLDV